MASGIEITNNRWFDAVPSPFSADVKAYYDPNLRGLIRHIKRKYPPGQRFQYHDLNAILIGVLLEKVSQTSLPELLEKRIWRPAGMAYPASWSLDSNRHRFPKVAAGLNLLNIVGPSGAYVGQHVPYVFVSQGAFKAGHATVEVFNTACCQCVCSTLFGILKQ